MLGPSLRMQKKIELPPPGVRLGLRGLLVRDSPELLCCVLKQDTFIRCLIIGSTQEDRKSSRHD